MAYYDLYDSPLGPIFIGGSERGLHRVAFQTEDEDLPTLVRLLEEDTGEPAGLDREGARPARMALAAYFAGASSDFELPLAPRGDALPGARLEAAPVRRGRHHHELRRARPRHSKAQHGPRRRRGGRAQPARGRRALPPRREHRRRPRRLRERPRSQALAALARGALGLAPAPTRGRRACLRVEQDRAMCGRRA